MKIIMIIIIIKFQNNSIINNNKKEFNILFKANKIQEKIFELKKKFFNFSKNK